MRNYLILFSLVLVISSPLLNSGFYTSPDGPNHLVRIAYFYKELQSGNLIPGWVNDLNWGKGYPIFFFAYPLPYYIAGLWHAVGFSIVDSLKTSLFLFLVMGAFGVYRWSKKVSSSILYLFTPYLFLDVFVRAAFGEIVFLGILPWAFWSLTTQSFPLTGIIVGLLILSHLQFSLIFLPLLFVYGLICKVKLRQISLSLGLGILLSAFFWLPALNLIGLTKYPQTHQFIPSQHLPTLHQLLYSPWGFGFSLPGPWDGLSFQVGMANWLILFLSTALLVRNRQALYLTFVCWLSIILMIWSPLNFWNWPITQSIQFPWRLLAIPLIFTPILLSYLPSRFPKIIISLLLVLAIYSNRNHIRTNLPQFVGSADADFLTSDTTTTATPDEFMPLFPKESFARHWTVSLGRIISLSSILIIPAYLLLQSKHESFGRHHRPKPL